MRFFGVLPVALLALVGTVGCISDDEAVVFVDANIVNPTASVMPGTLVTRFSGSFRLTLNLGPRASGPSKVSLGAFSIKGADEKTVIVSPLEAATTTVFPVEVPVDGETSVEFTFDEQLSDMQGTSVKDQLCAASGIRIAGDIQDSLQSGSTPAVSAVFHPSGCM
jgi:hypothetical protein